LTIPIKDVIYLRAGKSRAKRSKLWLFHGGCCEKRVISQRQADNCFDFVNNRAKSVIIWVRAAEKFCTFPTQ